MKYIYDLFKEKIYVRLLDSHRSHRISWALRIPDNIDRSSRSTACLVHMAHIYTEFVHKMVLILHMYSYCSRTANLLVPKIKITHFKFLSSWAKLN